MDAIVVHAHAKINLTLDVLHKRQDGYHDICSVMQSIALADELHLEKRPLGISVTANCHICAPRDNLGYKAAELFFAETGVNGGVHLHIGKCIPISAGLAGGSADCAGVLWGLDQLYGTDLPMHTLQRLGATLGADVPFCLQGGTLLAQGIGDRLLPVPSLPEMVVVLVALRHRVSTADVYRSLDSAHYGCHHSESFVRALKKGKLGALGNTLQTVTARAVPEVDLWQERLKGAGALTAAMSGSGPTVFGLFDALAVAEQFRGQFGNEGQIVVTRTWPVGVAMVTPQTGGGL